MIPKSFGITSRKGQGRRPSSSASSPDPCSISEQTPGCKKILSRMFLASTETSLSSAGLGPSPGRGGSHLPLSQKNQNLKQKQYPNKFKKNFKKVQKTKSSHSPVCETTSNYPFTSIKIVCCQDQNMVVRGKEGVGRVERGTDTHTSRVTLTASRTQPRGAGLPRARRGPRGRGET